MYDRNISRLKIILEAMASGNYSISVVEETDDFNHFYPLRLRESIEAKGISLSFEEIGRSALVLIEEKMAEWLLSPEGQAAQKSALGTEIFLGATNLSFPPEEARKLAEKEFQPFSAVIKILRQNGYTVEKNEQ